MKLRTIRMIKDKKYTKKIWRSILTVLSAVVVFMTTYALIIPAITWDRTLICSLEEHVHTDNCYNSKGDIVCGLDEHKHVDACFDAPKTIAKEYFCNKSEHTHTVDCYFDDGSLRCTLSEHIHTSECKFSTGTSSIKKVSMPFGTKNSIPVCTCGNYELEIENHNDLCVRKLWFKDFATVKTADEIYEQWNNFANDEQNYILKFLSWNYLFQNKLNKLLSLIDADKPIIIAETKTDDGVAVKVEGNIPENAEIEIKSFMINENNLKKYIGEKTYKLYNDIWTADISVLSEGVEYEPNGKVKVTVTNERFKKGYDYTLTVFHIHEESDTAETILADVSSDGKITFETDGFSPFVFASFTVDYYYGDIIYHQTGLSTMLLSDLFNELGVEKSINDVVDVSFDDTSLVYVEKVAGHNDWKLVSLKAFLSEQKLTVKFKDGSNLNIKTTDVATHALYIDSSVAGYNPDPSRTYKYHVVYYNSLGQIVEDWPIFSTSYTRKTYYVADRHNFFVEFVPEGLTNYDIGIQLGSDPMQWGQGSVTLYDVWYEGGAVCFYIRYQTAIGKIRLTKNAVNAPIGKIFTFKVSRHTYNYRMEDQTVQITNGQTAEIDYVYVPGYENYVKIEEINVDNGVSVLYSWNDGSSSGSGGNPIYINTKQSQPTINVTCSNTYPSNRSLTVKKTVVNEASGTEFNFTATIYRPNQQVYGSKSFKLKGGQQYVLNDIPDGCTVVLTETNSSGYTVSWNPSNSILMNADKTVTVTNTRNIQTVSVKKKIISFNPTSEGPFTFIVTVTDSNGNPIDVSRLTQQPGITKSGNTITATVNGFTSDGQTKTVTFNVPKNCKITVTETCGTKDYKTTITGADLVNQKAATINNVNSNKTITFQNEPPVQYTYIPITSDGSILDVSSTVGGTVTSTSEKVYISSGSAIGSTAVANSGYEFKGWFLDVACTQPAVGIVSDNQLTPIKSTDDYYHGGTYYALFAPEAINGIELPATGGVGSTLIYVIGALIMFWALTIGHIIWHRREGSGDI